jgi:TolA-binding protein
MTEARKLGWEDLLRNLPAEDLVLLAGTARLAGARDDSLTGFERVQKRFPGTQMADNALFQIARMVQSSGETARALQYYNTYLNNQPAGPYAMEASGRRLEVLQKMKRSEEAKAAAKAYLQTYPSGSHANVAQQILRADAP